MSGGTHRVRRPATPLPTLAPREERDRPVVLRYAAPPRPERRRWPAATAVMAGAVAVVCAFGAVVVAGAWTGITLLNRQAMRLDAGAPGDPAQPGWAAPVSPVPLPPGAADPELAGRGAIPPGAENIEVTDPGAIGTRAIGTASVNLRTLLTRREHAVVAGQGPLPRPSAVDRSTVRTDSAPPSPPAVPSAPLAAPPARTPPPSEGRAAATPPTGTAEAAGHPVERPPGGSSGASPARTPRPESGSSPVDAVPGARRPAPPAETASADRPCPRPGVPTEPDDDRPADAPGGVPRNTHG
jgi:hypothetical protein